MHVPTDAGQLWPDARILVVDDSELSLRVLTVMLEEAGFTNVMATTSSVEALSMWRSFEPDLALVDLHMPAPDGFAILEQLAETPRAEAAPVILLTADTDTEIRRRAFGLGAADFITKPFDATEVMLRVRNVLTARHRLVLLEAEVQVRTRDLDQARLELLSRLALAAEFRDDETHQHTQRVGWTSFLLAGRLAVEEADLIRQAAPLHDVGKIGIPDSILLKPGKLSDHEYEVMKTHADIGRRILSDSSSPVLRVGAQIASTHHERFDGRGYPHGLRGDEIPVCGRITAVADTFDAMTHDRPYRRAFPISTALEEIRRLAGQQFDPQVVAAFELLDHRSLVADVAVSPRPLVGAPCPDAAPSLAGLQSPAATA